MRFLFTTLPTNDLGLLARSLPIAHELRTQGHSVIYSSPAPAPRRVVADAGFENRHPPHPMYEFVTHPGRRGLVQIIRHRRWRPYGGPIRFVREAMSARPTTYPPPTSEVWSTDHAGATMGLLDERFVEANVAALRKLISETRPDVLVDFWNPMAVIAARSLGLPVVTVIQANAHPASAGFIWWKDKPADLPSPVLAVNRVLTGLGLGSIDDLAELSVGDVTLVVGTPATDPLPPGTDVTYVGSLIWEQPGSRLPDSVAGLGSDRPLVWVYSGNPSYGRRDTSLDSRVVIEASTAAFAGADMDVLLTTGHHSLPEELAPLPRNFTHERFVPGLAMAQASDVLVHHGGYGSCQTALQAGRPSVILPTYSERESNARRVEQVGAGIVVPVETVAGGDKRADPSALRRAVATVLDDPSFSLEAARVGDSLAALGGAAEAARIIEGFARAAA